MKSASLTRHFLSLRRVLLSRLQLLLCWTWRPPQRVSGGVVGESRPIGSELQLSVDLGGSVHETHARVRGGWRRLRELDRHYVRPSS